MTGCPAGSVISQVIVAAMLARLDEFETLQVDVDSELEA
jgi:hypothetical protein